MFTPILFVLAQAGLPAAPVDVRKEDSALLPFSGAVLYNNVYGKGDIANYRQLVFRGQDDAGWEWDWPESAGPSMKSYPEVLWDDHRGVRRGQGTSCPVGWPIRA